MVLPCREECVALVRITGAASGSRRRQARAPPSAVDAIVLVWMLQAIVPGLERMRAGGRSRPGKSAPSQSLSVMNSGRPRSRRHGWQCEMEEEA
jgi:hypothetical protein